MASLVHRVYLAFALTFLLRTFVVVTAAAAELLENPDLNRTTTVSLIFGVSQQQQTGNTSDNHANPVREPKALEVEYHQNFTITTSTELPPVSLAVHSTPRSKEADSRIMVKTTSSPTRVQATAKNRRSTPHRKHPNHHYSISSHSQSEDKRKIYVTNEDYVEQQYQNYQTDYYLPPVQEYEDIYSTIPVEDQGITQLDGVVSSPPNVSQHQTQYQPQPQPYVPQYPEYFEPPIVNRPVYEEPIREVYTRGCRCPETRQMACENSSAEFLTLVGMLGTNLWALLQLIVTSSLPFIIPTLIAKLILVPIGIFKFLSLIKIFFKLFIILPFFVRHIYPAFTQSFNLHDLLFQKIQDVAAHVHDHEIIHPHDADEIESRMNSNSTSSSFHSEIFKKVNDTSIWDLRDCPSRVACELGAFLSSSTNVNFPQKLANYLSKKADRVEARNSSDETNENNNVEYEDEDEEQDRIQQRDQAYRAFVIALGKKWKQEQCVAYSCAVLV